MLFDKKHNLLKTYLKKSFVWKKQGFVQKRFCKVHTINTINSYLEIKKYNSIKISISVKF